MRKVTRVEEAKDILSQVAGGMNPQRATIYALILILDCLEEINLKLKK